MSAHVLLNLLKKMGKSDEIRCLLSIVSIYHNELDKSIIQEHSGQVLFIICC